MLMHINALQHPSHLLSSLPGIISFNRITRLPKKKKKKKKRKINLKFLMSQSVCKLLNVSHNLLASLSKEAQLKILI